MIELILILPLITSVSSTCNIDQKSHCLDIYRKTVSFWNKDGEMNECSPKVYSEFTHICSVTNYLPSIDHCCCISKEAVHDPEEIVEDSGGRYRRLLGIDPPASMGMGDPASRGVGDPGSRGVVVRASRGVVDLPKVEGRHKRSSEPLLMCCRYHQDWNRFRCQEPLDTMDTKFAQSSVFQSNFESLTSSLLCYGFFVFVIMSFVAVIVCFIRRRNIRKYKARKDNATSASRANATGITPALFESFDEIPPPYSFHTPPYDGPHSLHHPLIPFANSRLEPSAPMEEERLLASSATEYFFDEERELGSRLDSTNTATTNLDASFSSMEDESSSRVNSGHNQDNLQVFSQIEAIGCPGSNSLMLSMSSEDLGGVRSNGRTGLDCRPVLTSTQVASVQLDPAKHSSDVISNVRVSPPPTYEESMENM